MLGLPSSHDEGGIAPVDCQGALMHFWGMKAGCDPVPTLTAAGERLSRPQPSFSSSPGTIFPNKMGSCAGS